MSSRNKGTIPETEAERALAELARQRFADYQSRWMPLQSAAARHLQAMYEPGSRGLQATQTMFGAEAAKQFTEAERAAEQKGWAGGINPGSARSRLTMAGFDTDRAASTGIGWSKARQIIDDAYLRGMSALAAAGRGQRADIGNAMYGAAQSAAQSAAIDARTSAANRAANYELAGIGAGMLGRGIATQWQQSGRQPGPSNVFEWGYPE